MAHLTGIGIENFRVFKDYTEFDFAPITILTGANNSGKSSLLKALLLLKDSFTGGILEALDFTKGSHKAGDMGNVLNDKDKPLTFYFPFKSFINNDLVISFEFILNDLKSKSFKSKCSKIIIYDKKGSNDKKKFHILFEVAFSHYTDRKEKLFIDVTWFKNNIEIFQSEPKINLKELFSKINKKEISKYKGVDYINDYGKEYIKSNDKLSYISTLEDLFSPWFTPPTNPPFERFIDKLINKPIKRFNVDIKEIMSTLSYLPSLRGTSERVYKNESTLNSILSDYFYLDNQNNNIGVNVELEGFANHWIEQFNIRHFDNIIIDNQPDLEMVLLYLQKGKDKKTKTFLIDLGFGTQQIIIILLKIVVEGVRNLWIEDPNDPDAGYQPQILLIEEPEANLHPKYQSLLADMLIDAADKFNIQFIIETHSEYLIRKLQYCVAKGTIKPTDVALYYLNDPESENVKNGKAKQVERIEIKEDGSIEENYEKYWSGFFDESERLQREIQEAKELHRIKQEKESLEKELLKVDYKCKCLIFTEDSENEKDFSETVFYDICGFKKDETRIIYYEGKDNLYPAIISTEVIKKDKPNISYIIFHRDRDIYEGNEDLVFGKSTEKIEKLNQKGQIKYYLFLTQNYDLESYFLNPNHIIELYPQLTLQEVEKLILQATESKKEDSIRRIFDKLDEIKDLKKKNRESINNYDISKELTKRYEENVVRYRYGKYVLEKLGKEIKKHLNIRTINLTRKTSVIQIPELQEIAKEIWN